MTARREEGEETHPLLKSGWIQGVMFDAPGASYELNVVQENGTGLARKTSRTTRSSDRLVLISHACDIVASDEKYVEALICKKHDPAEEILGAWNKNSPKYFVVDPHSAYVADASHRVKIEKDTLPFLGHYGNSMDELQHVRFVQWLARRYDRPVVPGRIYKGFHAPVYAELTRLHEEDWKPFETFDQVTHDIRIYLPAEESPPYSLGVVYLTRRALTEDELKAIMDIHRVIVGAAHDEVKVEGMPAIVELDEVPYGTILRTQPLIIEHPSWQNEEAAPPAWLLNALPFD